jgi:membrane protein implicated in regulation of membrane protease activity
MFTKTDIEKYFVAEKGESLFFLMIGVGAILLSVWFFAFLKTNFYKGAAIPLVVIGLLQIVVGYTVYARSDEQRISNVYAYSMDPDKLKNTELPRMKTVNRNFVIYRWTEIGFLLTGVVLIFLCRTDPAKSFWFGLGIALALQAATLLVADRFAEQRALFYTKGLEEFAGNKSNG